MFKVLYSSPLGAENSSNTEHWQGYKIQDFRMLRDLMQLYEEGNIEDLESSADPSTVEASGVSELGVCPSFKNKSQKFPILQSNPNIWAFLQNCSRDIQDISVGKNKGNLSYSQLEAIKKLEGNHNIIIKPSDKGGNVVVMNTNQYVSMCKDILTNKDWYQMVDETIIDQFKNEFLAIIYGAYSQTLIDKNTLSFLDIKHPKTPTFYALPKIHKRMNNPPGRPIVSGCGNLTEKASKLIDDYLRPHVTALPSYIKDTLDFLKVLDGVTVPEHVWLVTIDVEALYSSIPHTLGLAAVRDFLRERPATLYGYNVFILDLLRFILTHNVFTFEGSHYLQVQGVAMGTCCAPSYANLYLGGWERTIFSDEELNRYLCRVITWHRYIDDIFLIWGGSHKLLLEFLDKLNDNLFNLKFTMNCDMESITFLDVTVKILPDKSVGTSLFRKETSGNSILHFTSSHPTSLKRSIPYSQYLRLKRNCSSNEDFEMEARKLRERLLLRGYSRSILKKAYNKTKTKTREQLLYGKSRNVKLNNDDTSPVRIITKFSTQHHEIRNIIEKHWHFLTEDRKITRFVDKSPSLVFRRTPSLKDRLVQSHFSHHSIPNREISVGTYRCHNCSFCSWIHEGPQVILPNGKMWHPKHHNTCRTEGIIYLMQCQCGCFYVGKTIRAFWKRISDHIYLIKNGKMTTPISLHVGIYHNFDSSCIKFYALEHVPKETRGGDWDKRILQKETKWIFSLKATVPPGLNDCLSFRSFLPT